MKSEVGIALLAPDSLTSGLIASPQLIGRRSGAEECDRPIVAAAQSAVVGELFITGRRDRWWNGALACEATV